MSDLTYLIGAGASIGAIPVVGNFMYGLEKFKEDINKYKYDPNQPFFHQDVIFTTTPEVEIKELLRDIEWLINEAKNFSTIDTLAKKLFLTNEIQKYEVLKRILLLYFNYRQATKPVDQRYDNFFATLLTRENDKLVFPENINIVTWNYDFQFELSISKFYSKAIEDVYSDVVNIHYPASPTENDDDSKLKIFKLNGSAIFLNQSSNIELLNKEMINNDIHSLKSVLYKNMKLIDKTYKNLLKFSWENLQESSFFKKVNKIIANSSDLVVIGYSFPQFNKSIDSTILSSFNQSNKLYIQDPNPSNILDTVSLLTNRNKNTISIINDKSKFYIPHDFIPRYTT